MRDHILRWGGLVIGDIVDARRGFVRDRGQERACNIVNVNAVEDLSRLDQPARLALLEIDEGIASGAVDARKAEDLYRDAGLP